jgi:hypothetical protein
MGSAWSHVDGCAKGTEHRWGLLLGESRSAPVIEADAG